MRLIPFLSAIVLAASLSAADLGYTVPLDAKLENGQPDPRAGLTLPASNYSVEQKRAYGDKFIGKVDGEVFVFGKSYHSNRSIDYNETNPGVALGIAYHDDEHLDVTLAGGQYKDSYREHARFALAGIRYVWGDRDGAHATAGFSLGYFKGSDFHGVGFLPVVSVGYDWIDMCVTGDPAFGGNSNNGSRDPQENRGATGGFIAAFLKFRVATF
jgi:hypothetical protein